MKKSNYKKITAVLLVLLLVLGICPGTAFAEPAQTSHPSGSLEPTETAQPIQADDEATLMEETVSAEAFSPLIPIDEEPAAGINATAATASTASATIADGIYAFKNITNTGRWMDTQYDSTQAGYHMQQYAYNPSPATSSALYALFKVTHAGSGRYIIRLMLNNELSFGVSGSDILTKTIAVDDSDVPTSDMFYINYDSASGGYTIEPCANPGYLVAARQTTASGSAGAPNSYLLAVPKSSSSSYSATWQPHVYTGPIDFGDVYPHYIPDGVYAFANVNNDGLWMDTQQDKILPGYHIQQYAYPTNPTEAFERGGLFKIKRDGTSNRYIIRSMLNNRMTMTTAGTYGTDIITEELTAYDDDVSTADMFYINYDATIGTYTVEPCSDPGYVIAARQTTASGASGEPNSFLTLVSKSSTSYSPNWFLHRYMGPDQSGGMANYNNPFIAGSTGRVTAYAWSTIVGANVQYMYIGNDQANIATGTWSENDYKLYVSPHDEGDFRVFIDIYKNTEIQHRFALDLRVELPVKNGNYFFKSYSTHLCIQPIAGASTDYELINKFINLDVFNGETYQRWKLIHVNDGFYQIESLSSSLYLTTSENKIILTQEPIIFESTQLWGISKTNRNTFTVKSKFYEETNGCLTVDNQNLIVADSSTSTSEDQKEWYIRPVEYAFSIGGEFVNGEDVLFAHNTWKNCGYVSNYNINPTINSLNVNSLNSSVAYFSAHGSQHYISLKNNVFLGDATTFLNIRISDMSIPKAKLYIYDACQTAKDDGSGYNLCTATISAGAECVIGWTENILVVDTAIWQQHFQDQLVKGKSVLEAANYANTFNYNNNSRMKSWVIYGNQDITLNEPSLSISTETNLIQTNIEYLQHDENTVRTILSSHFSSFVDAPASVRIIYTDATTTDYVIDFYYLNNGSITDIGYSLIVQDGYIKYMRDNTNNKNITNLAFKTTPIVTSQIIESAYTQACDELTKMGNSYTLCEQSGECYYDVKTKKYYYRVNTVYRTDEGTYGAFLTLFELE